jgi:DNA-binding beta-propeller fold protein YncE
MKQMTYLSALFILILVFIPGCTGPTGSAGPQGPQGDSGDPANPSAVYLSTPRFNSATASAVISWTINVDGNFQEYRLYRSDTPGVTESSTLMATITDRYSAFYEDAFGTKPTNYYYYKVYSYNLSATSTPSNEVILTGLYLLEFSFGSSGAGDGEFNFPRDVAVDDDGNIFVADSDNFRIQKFDSSGGYLDQWGVSGTGNGEFGTPTLIEYAPDGYLYVGDWGNNRVQIFDTDGGYVNQFLTVGGPGDSFIAENGDVYVPDNTNNLVRWFDPSFAPWLTWGGLGTGPGQFTNIWDIEASPDGGRLYVLDQANDRVQIFTNNGVYLSQFVGSGTAPGQCVNCWGLAVDNNGLVYVTDQIEGRVQIYDEYGGFIEDFVILVAGPGPLGVCFDTDNNLYVVDAWNNMIHVFGP